MGLHPLPPLEAPQETAVEGIGALGLHSGQARHPVDEAQLLELAEGLAEGAGVAQVARWQDDPVGRFPAQLLHRLEDDALLPLQAEGVERIQQVDAQLVADPAHQLHGSVEIALHLQGLSAVG